jgi:hypothetical protein
VCFLSWQLRLGDAQAATIVVETFAPGIANDGDCSLQEAIASVNTGTAPFDCPNSDGRDDRIVLPAGSTPFAPTQTLEILRSVTIVGGGMTSTTIRTTQTFGFVVAGSPQVITLRLQGLTLTQGPGAVAQAQGVYVQGDGADKARLLIDDVRITGYGGNAIRMDSFGDITVGSNEKAVTDTMLVATDCMIDDNDFAGVQVVGPAWAEFHGCTISSNEFSGLALIDGANGLMTHSRVVNNKTPTHGGGIFYFDGFLTESHYAVTHSEVSGNEADGNGGGVYQGSNTGSNNGLEMNHVTLSGNRAAFGGGLYEDRVGSYSQHAWLTVAFNNAEIAGGGMYLTGQGSGTMSFDGCLIAQNTINEEGDPSVAGTDVNTIDAEIEGGEACDPADPCRSAPNPDPQTCFCVHNVWSPRFSVIGTADGWGVQCYDDFNVEPPEDGCPTQTFVRPSLGGTLGEVVRPLAYNGWDMTQVHVPTTDPDELSAALDVWPGQDSSRDFFDQRGLPRPVDANGVSDTFQFPGGDPFATEFDAGASELQCLFSLVSQATGTCSTGPRAIYPFREGSGSVAGDFSGNGLHGALLNGASFVQGIFDRAVDINGGTQFVDLPNGLVQPCSDFTFASWVRLDSNGNWGRIFDFGNNTTTNMFLTPAAGNPNTLRFAIKVPGINGGAEAQVSAAFTFPIGVWTHVAAVLQGNTGTLYVNGAVVASNTNVVANPSNLGNTVNNWLGESQYTADPTLNGRLDEVEISCRAYSAQQIATLADPVGPFKCQVNDDCDDGDPCTSDACETIQPGIVDCFSSESENCATGEREAYYAFNQASGTAVTDGSGNGNTGTLTNGASFTTAGRLGNGVAIGGGNQFVDLPNGLVSGCADFTFASWVRLNSNPTWARIFDFGSGTATNMFLTPAAGNPNTLRFAIKVPGINGGAEAQISHPFTFPLSTWTHVAVVLKGNTGTLFVNGVPVAVNANVAANPSNLGNTLNDWLGESQYPADPNLNGTLDDVWISCRAYTDREIAHLADIGNAVTAIASVDADWGTGYCVDLLVTNGATSPTTNWNVGLDLQGTTITQSWNGTFSASSGSISVVPAFSWNRVIAAGATNDSVGFCADRPTNAGTAVVTSSSGTF